VKVLLIVIDAATPRVVGPAIQTGRLPVMRRLVEAGTYHDTCTTIFPSITPAATSAIITGEYPAANGIVGASWFDEDSQDVAYYGDDFWVIAREGFRSFLDDFLLRLNGDRLRAPTLFEIVERAGAHAACLNYLVFKGLCEHIVHVPTMLRLLPGVRSKEVVRGPSIIAIGDFLTTRTMRGKPLDDVGGVLHRFGMDDASTSELLLELAEDRLFPDLTVAYYADNDYRSHQVGPYESLEVVERVDRGLGRAFDAAGGIDRVLSEMFVIIVSDHGHCEVLGERDRAAIHLDQVLCHFRQATLGQTWRPGDEIMICPNMRAAQVYFHHPTAVALRRAVKAVVADSRVDHAVYRGSDIDGIADHFWIESEKGGLSFFRGATGATHAVDAFGNTWSWEGDLSIIDAHVENGRLEWNDYPNAFERLAGVLEHPHSATLWVTAKPGCEFEVPGGEAHLGGASHGALHALESYCPLIVAGPRRIAVPKHFRTVDVAPLCLQLLGLPSRHRVGDPRRR
jgi:predicted AlkP superfamily pyrophosphatase or phosphodiesterase